MAGKTAAAPKKTAQPKATKAAKAEEPDCPAPVKRTRKAKTPKDPNMPKKADNAYFLFKADHKKKHPKMYEGKSVTEAAKLQGAEWRKVKDTPAGKPYLEKAAKLKAAYEKEMEAYNAKQGVSK